MCLNLSWEILQSEINYLSKNQLKNISVDRPGWNLPYGQTPYEEALYRSIDWHFKPAHLVSTIIIENCFQYRARLDYAFPSFFCFGIYQQAREIKDFQKSFSMAKPFSHSVLAEQLFHSS